MVPYRSCNGVRDEVSEGFFTGFSNFERVPISPGGGPSTFVGSLIFNSAWVMAFCTTCPYDDFNNTTAAVAAPPNKIRRLNGLLSLFSFSCSNMFCIIKQSTIHY